MIVFKKQIEQSVSMGYGRERKAFIPTLPQDVLTF
jgi:hypothetical protein